MPAFGTGVNAALGRIDYTPYLQGSLQGSAAIGRGLASLGESAAGAIKEYSQNKEMRDLITQNNETQAQKALAISKAFQNNPEIFGNIQPISDKTIQDLKTMSNMSIGKLKNLNAELNAAITKYEPVIAEYGNQMREARAIRAATSSVVPPSNALAQYIMGGGRNPRQFSLDQANINNQNAQTGLYGAQAKAAGQPRENEQSQFETVLKTSVDAWSAENGGQKPPPDVMSRLAQDASAAVTGKSPGQETEALLIGHNLKRGEAYNDRARVASEALPKMARVLETLSKGPGAVDTGFGAEFKNDVRGIFYAFGFPVDEDKMANTQVLQSLLGQNLLTILSQTKGSTSNKETDLYRTMSASINKNPKAIKELLQLTLYSIKSDIEMDRAFQDEMDKSGSAQKANKAAQDIRQQRNKEQLDKIDALSKQYNSPSAKPSALAPGGRTYFQDRVNDVNIRLDALTNRVGRGATLNNNP